jgi:Mechanosensitive ion channel, conserved TM helix
MDDKPLESVRDVMTNLVAYLPNLLAGLIVLVLGMIVAWIGSKLLVRLLLFLRIDRVISRLGWGRTLEKGDVRHSLFGLIGTVVGILIFLIFLENAVVIWKMTVLSQLLEKLVLLIPQIILAVLLLLVGWGVATTVSRSVQRALYQEEFERARLVARIVHAAILVVAAAIALVELNIAVVIVTGAFLIAFGALALSFVFAVGLGSKRAVEKMWEERFRRQQEEREKEAERSKEK